MKTYVGRLFAALMVGLYAMTGAVAKPALCKLDTDCADGSVCRTVKTGCPGAESHSTCATLQCTPKQKHPVDEAIGFFVETARLKDGERLRLSVDKTRCVLIGRVTHRKDLTEGSWTWVIHTDAMSCSDANGKVVRVEQMILNRDVQSSMVQAQQQILQGTAIALGIPIGMLQDQSMDYAQ